MVPLHGRSQAQRWMKRSLSRAVRPLLRGGVLPACVRACAGATTKRRELQSWRRLGGDVTDRLRPGVGARRSERASDVTLTIYDPHGDMKRRALLLLTAQMQGVKCLPMLSSVTSEAFSRTFYVFFFSLPPRLFSFPSRAPSLTMRWVIKVPLVSPACHIHHCLHWSQDGKLSSTKNIGS